MVPQPGFILESALWRPPGTRQSEGGERGAGGGGTRSVLSAPRAVHSQHFPPGPFSRLPVPQTCHDFLPLSLFLGCSFCLLCLALPHAGRTCAQEQPEHHSLCSPCSVKNRSLPPRAPTGWPCPGVDITLVRSQPPHQPPHQGGARRGQGRAGCPCGSWTLRQVRAHVRWALREAGRCPGRPAPAVPVSPVTSVQLIPEPFSPCGRARWLTLNPLAWRAWPSRVAA